MFTQPDLTRITVQLLQSRKSPEKLAYARVPSPYGNILLIASDDVICYLGFEMNPDKDLALSEVGKIWPRIPLEPDESVRGLLFPSDGICRVYVKATPFQMRVWSALLEVKAGEAIPYSELAERIGLPSATRAVASAVAANPVSLLIPCHRIVRKGGDYGNYHWGKERKKAILRSETEDPHPVTGTLGF